MIAGVAWAQHVGIDGVEVSIDGGDWQAAELSDELSIDTWRQWRYALGRDRRDVLATHEVKVRATGKDGETQTEDAGPAPPGRRHRLAQHRVRRQLIDCSTARRVANLDALHRVPSGSSRPNVILADVI